jgi:thiol-disulfide isomerase/thioredoxin
MAVAVGLVLTQSGPDGGVPHASARCLGGEAKCLPELDLVDTDGHVWTSEALAGKVVLVNFWATWCKPCVAEIPELTRIYEHYRDQGLVVLGVMTDNVSDARLADFAARVQLDYPVVRVDHELMAAFEYPDALPTTFVYDREGRLVHHYRGPLSERHLKAWLEPLMAL